MTSTYPCVVYNDFLDQKIPCTIVPDNIKEFDGFDGRNFYVVIQADESKFNDFALSVDEVRRYVKNTYKLFDIYPYSTQEEIDYADNVIPNSISENHYEMELNRFCKLVEIICSPSEISEQTYYSMGRFISYELLFMYCTPEERLFMQTLSDTVLTEVPDPILIPQMVKMTYLFMTKYNDTDVDRNFNIYNYRDFYWISYIPFPIVINKDNLKANAEFLDPHLNI